MKIKSVTNVITNSSTEVFLMKRDEKYFNLLKEFGIDESLFLIIDSKERLKEIILKGIEEEETHEYYLLRECAHTAGIQLADWNSTSYQDIPFWKTLKEAGKTDEEIIDFFMPVFEPMIGTACFSFCDEGGCWHPDSDVLSFLATGDYMIDRI